MLLCKRGYESVGHLGSIEMVPRFVLYGFCGIYLTTMLINADSFYVKRVKFIGIPGESNRTRIIDFRKTIIADSINTITSVSICN